MQVSEKQDCSLYIYAEESTLETERRINFDPAIYAAIRELVGLSKFSPSQVDGEKHVRCKNHVPTHTPIHYPDSHSVIQAFRHA
jgi:hypothetical protein